MSKLSEIDPALELMEKFAKVTGKAVSHIDSLRKEAIFTTGDVPAKYKVLAACLWAIAGRCESCIKFYIMQATKLGATEKEVGEFLAIASTMGGCVGEMWALKAFKAYHDKQGTDSCCQA